MDPEHRRVAEIWTGGRVGSGYLVSGRHVLTARHVLDRKDGAGLVEQCEVRCLRQQDWFRATVKWLDEGLDLAVLEISDRGWKEPDVDPVRWGWVLGARAVSCTAVGFPDAQRQVLETRSVRDTEQLQGEIDPLTLSKAQKLGISLARGVPVERGRAQTWWSGMSGASVFAEGALVGVVVAVPQQFGGRRLNATAVSTAVRNHRLAAILAQAGLHLRLEPVPSVRGLR